MYTVVSTSFLRKKNVLNSHVFSDDNYIYVQGGAVNRELFFAGPPPSPLGAVSGEMHGHGMHHGHGHEACAVTCSMDMKVQHGHEYAIWT